MDQFDEVNADQLSEGEDFVVIEKLLVLAAISLVLNHILSFFSSSLDHLVVLSRSKHLEQDE